MAAQHPRRLREAAAPFRADGTLPDYPLGSDFTAVEQRIVRALAWLQANTATPAARLRTVLQALAGAPPADPEVLERMDLRAGAGPGCRRACSALAWAGSRATIDSPPAATILSAYPIAHR